MASSWPVRFAARFGKHGYVPLDSEPGRDNAAPGLSTGYHLAGRRGGPDPERRGERPGRRVSALHGGEIGAGGDVHRERDIQVPQPFHHLLDQPDDFSGRLAAGLQNQLVMNPAGGPPRRWPNEYFVGAINRVCSENLEDTDYYGSSYFASPRGSDHRRHRLGHSRRGRGAGSGPRPDRGGPASLGFLQGPPPRDIRAHHQGSGLLGATAFQCHASHIRAMHPLLGVLDHRQDKTPNHTLREQVRSDFVYNDLCYNGFLQERR